MEMNVDDLNKLGDTTTQQGVGIGTHRFYAGGETVIDNKGNTGLTSIFALGTSGIESHTQEMKSSTILTIKDVSSLD